MRGTCERDITPEEKGDCRTICESVAEYHREVYFVPVLCKRLLHFNRENFFYALLKTVSMVVDNSKNENVRYFTDILHSTRFSLCTAEDIVTLLLYYCYQTEPAFYIENNVLKGKVVSCQTRNTSVGTYLLENMKKNSNLIAQVC